MRRRFAVGMACAALLALGMPSTAAAADPGPSPAPVNPGSGVIAQAVKAADLGPGTAPGAGPPAATPPPRPSTPAPPHASPPTRPHATPAPTHPATPTPAHDPALAAAVAAWVAGGGEDDLATLGEDFTVLEQAASSGQLPAMGAGCRRLGTDVRAIQSHAPIPDARAERYWAAALASYARGAADCVAGTGAGDNDLMMKASDEIIEGSDDIDRVTERLNEIG